MAMCGHSRDTRAVRRRTSPAVTPYLVSGNPAEKIHLYLRTALRPSECGSGQIQAEPGLAKGSSQAAVRVSGWRWQGEHGEVLDVHAPTIRECIHQHHAGKPDFVFRRAFDFGLALLFDLRRQQTLLVFYFAYFATRFAAWAWRSCAGRVLFRKNGCGGVLVWPTADASGF